MSDFMRAFISAIALLLTVSLCHAEPKCGDAAVLELFAEAIKCQEVAPCAGEVIRGTSRDLAKMSDAELRRGTLRTAFEKPLPNLRAQPYFVQLANFTADLDSSVMIGWRDAFRTMKASATAVDYDPSRRRYTCQGRFSFDPALLSEAIRRFSLWLTLAEPTTMKLVLTKMAEGQDPTPILAGKAKRAERYVARCFNTNRVFYVQPERESKLIVNLDKSTMVPGCRAS